MVTKRLFLLLLTSFMLMGCMSIDVRLDRPLAETENGFRVQLMAIKQAAAQLEARLPSDHARVIQRATNRAHGWRGHKPEVVRDYLALAETAKIQIDGFNARYEEAKQMLRDLDMDDEDERQEMQYTLNSLRLALLRMHDENLLGRIYAAAQAVNRL